MNLEQDGPLLPPYILSLFYVKKKQVILNHVPLMSLLFKPHTAVVIAKETPATGNLGEIELCKSNTFLEARRSARLRQKTHLKK